MRKSRSEGRKTGLAIAATAREGGGKTWFGLSFPKPIAYINVDPNTNAIIEKAIREKIVARDDIQVHEIVLPAIAFSDQDDVQSEAESSWEAMIDVLKPIVTGDADPMPKSVVLDTASEIHVLNVLAEFGKTDQISPESRRNRMGPVNSRYKGIVRALTDRGVHVCLLHRADDLWRNVNEDTNVRGRGASDAKRERVEGTWAMERKGFKETGFITSTEVFLGHDPEKSEKIVGQFGMYIARCSLRPGLKTREYWGREKLDDGSRLRRASFPYLMTRIHEGSSFDDWE